MRMITTTTSMPGPSAPAFRFTGKSGVLGVLSAALVASLMLSAAPAAAQAVQPGARLQQPSVQPPPSIRPTPSQLELSRMIWSTVAAVDHANRSGNYSVLRDISAQNFQINYNPARLTEIFAGLRNSNIDLSTALLVPPTYYEAPQMLNENLFRVKGLFQLRPVSIQFDMAFQWEQGRWKLAGIDIQPAQMVAAPPARQ
ncbi:MAG: hypothetical protein AAF559_02100 [Pseudomonadota bacterium]